MYNTTTARETELKKEPLPPADQSKCRRGNHKGLELIIAQPAEKRKEEKMNRFLTALHMDIVSYREIGQVKEDERMHKILDETETLLSSAGCSKELQNRVYQLLMDYSNEAGDLGFCRGVRFTYKFMVSAAAPPEFINPEDAEVYAANYSL